MGEVYGVEAGATDHGPNGWGWDHGSWSGPGVHQQEDVKLLEHV